MDSSPEAAAAAYPRAVLLYFYGKDEDDKPGFPNSAAELQTVVAAHTSGEHLIRVSFHFAVLPEASILRLGYHDDSVTIHTTVVAVHGDSMLFEVAVGEIGKYGEPKIDLFVYNAGAAAGPSPRPPSVSLLPPDYLTGKELEEYKYRSLYDHDGPLDRSLDPNSTGLLRCGGEDEFVVAEFKMAVEFDDNHIPKTQEAELVLFRSGEWSVYRPTVMISPRCR